MDISFGPWCLSSIIALCVVYYSSLYTLRKTTGQHSCTMQ